MQNCFEVNERRVCRVIRFYRFIHRYHSKADQQAFLRKRIKEIASTSVRYGYKRIHVLLRREGWKINAKLACWLYKLECLNLRNKSKLKKISQN